MSRWFRVVVPLGVAAVLVSVLAIGFGSPSSHAAKPAAEPQAPSGCNSAMDATGRLGPGKSVNYTATFCSDPADSFVVWVAWGNKINADKDLALHVTAPDGREFYVDHDPSAIEVFVGYAPLPEGDWVVEVVNEGSRSVKYEISFGFG